MDLRNWIERNPKVHLIWILASTFFVREPECRNFFSYVWSSPTSACNGSSGTVRPLYSSLT